MDISFCYKNFSAVMIDDDNELCSVGPVYMCESDIKKYFSKPIDEGVESAA